MPLQLGIETKQQPNELNVTTLIILEKNKILVYSALSIYQSSILSHQIDAWESNDLHFRAYRVWF